MIKKTDASPEKTLDRLQETYKQCLSGYESWQKDQKDSSAREALMQTMHDLRRVLSRMEIEILTSQSDARNAQPLPVPPHRSKRPMSQNQQQDRQNQQDSRQDSKSANVKPIPIRETDDAASNEPKPAAKTDAPRAEKPPRTAESGRRVLQTARHQTSKAEDGND